MPKCFYLRTYYKPLLPPPLFACTSIRILFTYTFYIYILTSYDNGVNNNSTKFLQNILIYLYK